MSNKSPLKAPDGWQAGYKSDGTGVWYSPVNENGGGWYTISQNGNNITYREHTTGGGPAKGWSYNTVTGEGQTTSTSGKTNR